MKNHDFTPKNHIFSNFRGGGGEVRTAGAPLDPPLHNLTVLVVICAFSCGTVALDGPCFFFLFIGGP